MRPRWSGAVRAAPFRQHGHRRRLVGGEDNAERVGWEFDEYATYIPKRKITKAKAPAPRPQKQEPSRVGTLEDPSRPDWLVAEMNECFGNTWTPNA